MHILGILLFIALIVADIVRIFKDDDEFDGIMLFARPIVAFVGALLCDGTFWEGLLWAAGWGIVGFVVAMLISEHISNSSDITDDASVSVKTDSNHQSSPISAGAKHTQPASNTTPLRTQSSEPSPHLAKQPSGSFEFAFNILPEQDARYNKARASNGVVYYRFSNGESPIGYYELTDSGTRVNIYCTSDKGLIGYAAGDEIYISRKALYDRKCKVRDENGYNYYIEMPVPMELNLAEIRNGAIKDNKSYEYLGRYQGDKYAAAAAFVCLIYECHMKYKYSLFFTDWDK